MEERELWIKERMGMDTVKELENLLSESHTVFDIGCEYGDKMR